MSLLCSLDEGTSSTRFALFSPLTGKLIESSQKEISTITFSENNKAGWAEQNPQEILSSVSSTLHSIVQSAPHLIGEIFSLGITNQRESCLLWNKHSALPYSNLLLWHDSRTSDIVKELENSPSFGSKFFRSTCGLPLSTYFSLPKILWIIKHHPQRAQLIKDIQNGDVLFGTVDTFLLWHLTGGSVHRTDVTNASRTLLMNIHTGQWDSQAIDVAEKFLNINNFKSILPEIRYSADDFGKVVALPSPSRNSKFTVTMDIPKEFNGIPIRGVIGDQQSALLGQLCIAEGQAKNTYGTGCFLLMNVGIRPIQSQNGLLTTAAFSMRKTGGGGEGKGENMNSPSDKKSLNYALEGSVAVAGSLLKWLRDSAGLLPSYDALSTLLAEEAEGNAKGHHGIFFVPAFSGLYAPYWDPSARGLLVGLTFSSNGRLIVRSAVEAAALQIVDILTAMKSDSKVTLKTLAVDGGMTKSPFLLQFQSDVLGIPIVKGDETEATALGAALAAGLGGGMWESEEKMKNSIERGRAEEKKGKGEANAVGGEIFYPKMGESEREGIVRKWRNAVERARDWEITEDKGKPNGGGGGGESCWKTWCLSVGLPLLVGLSVGISIGLSAAMRCKGKGKEKQN